MGVRAGALRATGAGAGAGAAGVGMMTVEGEEKNGVDRNTHC